VCLTFYWPIAAEVIEYAVPRMPAPLLTVIPFTPTQRPVFEGSLAVLTFADAVQLVCMLPGVHRLVVDNDGEEIGRILSAEAQVIGARTPALEGDAAFVSLCRIRLGRVLVHACSPAEPRDLPALTRGWQELLLDAARLDDEERRDRERAEVAAAAPLPQVFTELYREAVAAYVRRDYEAALRLFERCLRLRPDDRHVRHNLERLAKFRRPE
jgi:hypothetical protein